MCSSRAKTGHKCFTRVRVIQGHATWCFLFQGYNLGCLTTLASSLRNHAISSSWFELICCCIQHMLLIMRFYSRVVKHSKVTCQHLMRDYAVFGFEFYMSWSSSWSLCVLAMNLIMLQYWWWYVGLVGDIQKFIAVRFLFRLPFFSSNPSFDYL